MIELSISQAKKHPENFMYIWADEERFLRYIKPKYASIIRTKKANQRKLILLSAQKYINKNAVMDGTEFKQYTDTIRQAFINAYAMTPAEALVKLASGETVAGKNWEKGVYGIGAVQTEFSGYEINGQKITVNKENGHIYMGNTDITDESKTVYGKVGNKTVACQVFSKDMQGVTFSSAYKKGLKKYSAESWSDDYATYSAKNGQEMDASDSANVWGSIIMALSEFISWLISLFGGSSEKETINNKNTLPNQQEDGFTYTTGFGEAGMIALALVAGGALLMGAPGKKKGKK